MAHMQNASQISKQPGTGGGPLAWLTANTLTGMRRRKAAMGYLFLLPTVLGILIFTAGPVLVSFGLSFFQWNVFTAPQLVGAENYQRLITDKQVLTSFLNTFRFVAMAVTTQIVLALILALAVTQKMGRFFRYYFRSAFFLPLLMSSAAVSISLGYMFHREFGVVNYYLTLIGLPRVPWLNSSTWALITVMIAYVWHQLGFTFILFIGGLTNISPEILDAADVDGATGLRRIWHIILPMLSPTLLFAIVVSVIGALQVFEQPYIMTRGGPGDASRTAVMVMYEAAFKNLEFGYGSAITVILFIVIMLVTMAQFWLSRRWVFYQ
ncbi:sugar ABC transporter permease [Litorilinea aerophila]|nr:sugar ABC transporter permease [Litorilinea aerophila]MCC9077448.1 sugar ABC transporter permease [Litorilinea aerophila]GIV77584.1 MAG: sugar ABC transporter permease [Litorilinea sp.]